MTLPDLAFQDDLTGVHNRRYLSHLIGEGWPGLVSRHGQVAVLIVDLDAFKAINDRHGHLTGDDVLCATARLLRQHFRSGDVILRYGGDEFVVFAPGVGAAEVASLAERARQALASERLVSRKTGRALAAPLGFSIGVASFPADGATGEAVLQAADRRLYEDKRRRGRTAKWVFLPRKLVYVALALASVLGVLVGSYVGARVETSVSEVEALRAAPTPAGDRRVEDLTAQIAELSERLARPPEGTPVAAPTPVPDRVGELEAEILRLRRELEVRRSRATPVPFPSAAAPPASVSPAIAPAARAPRRDDAARPVEPTPPERVPPRSRETDAVAVRKLGSEGRDALPAPTPVLTPPPRPPVFRPAVPLDEVKPRYPRVAQALREQATIEVHVVVDARGRVTLAEVIGNPAGYGFKEAALEAARRTTFRPATRDGLQVPAETVLRYRFKLD